MRNLTLGTAHLRQTLGALGYDGVIERVWPTQMVVDTHTHPFDVNALGGAR